MVKKIIEALEIPLEQSINCVAETGNCGNALPLLQLDALKHKMRRGDKAIGIAIESSKWLQSGIMFDYM